MQRYVVLENQVSHVAFYQLRPLIIARSCLDFSLPLPCERSPDLDRDSTADFPKPEMIESFNVPLNSVAKWAGITSAVFSLTQAVTGVLWGRASDRWGRKPAILAGVICAMFSSLAFGFSSSLVMAIVARSFAGATNGNVGTFRTVVAEMIPEKELQPRAFSIMPLVYTVGSIFGPALGGALANPATNYPNTFGNSALLKKYPYALPNIAASVLFMIGLITGILFLKVRWVLCGTRPTMLTFIEESLASKKRNRDYGRVLGRSLVHAFGRAKSKVMRHVDNENTPLLKDSRSSVSSGRCDDIMQLPPKIKPPSPPTYREVRFEQKKGFSLYLRLESPPLTQDLDFHSPN